MNINVSFELAKLLKEKGFNKRGYLQDVWLGNRYEGKHPKVKEIPVFGLGSTSVLPTISDVVMWLYEKHGVWISVQPISMHKWKFYLYTNSITSVQNISLVEANSPTEAYETAIEYSLKNLAL